MLDYKDINTSTVGFDVIRAMETQGRGGWAEPACSSDLGNIYWGDDGDLRGRGDGGG